MTTKTKQDPAAIIRDLLRQLAESEKERAAAVELAEKQRKKIVILTKRKVGKIKQGETMSSITITLTLTPEQEHLLRNRAGVYAIKSGMGQTLTVEQDVILAIGVQLRDEETAAELAQRSAYANG